jgi:hypothetical protein
MRMCELLPCPFCNRKPELTVSSTGLAKIWGIKCCILMYSNWFSAYDNERSAKIKNAIINKWNTRVQPTKEELE